MSTTSLPAAERQHAIATFYHTAAVPTAVLRRPQQTASTQQQLLQQQPHLQFLQLAHDLADAAGLITTRYFRTKLNVDSKSDASPVTIADRQAEEAMRKLIAAAYPSHAVFGEEAGLTLGSISSSSSGDGSNSSSSSGDEWLWVLDPIDGTKSFITGGRARGCLLIAGHSRSGNSSSSISSSSFVTGGRGGGCLEASGGSLLCFGAGIAAAAATAAAALGVMDSTPMGWGSSSSRDAGESDSTQASHGTSSSSSKVMLPWVIQYALVCSLTTRAIGSCGTSPALASAFSTIIQHTHIMHDVSGRAGKLLFGTLITLLAHSPLQHCPT